jgi:WD40 repeat protein
LRDAQRGTIINALRGHFGTISSVAFSSDGRRLVTAGADDQSAILWDIMTGAIIRRFECMGSVVYSAAISRDGNRVVCGLDHATAIIWDANTGARLHTLHGHNVDFFAVCFNPDGASVLAAGSVADEKGATQSAFDVWDVSTGRRIHDGEVDLVAVASAAFTPDGSRILLGSILDSTGGAMFDAKTGHLLYKLEAGAGPCHTVAFAPGGRQFVTADSHVAYVWDAMTGGKVRELKQVPDDVSGAAYLPDGNRIALCSHDGLALWDSTTGDKLSDVGKVQSTDVGSVAIDATTRTLVFCGDVNIQPDESRGFVFLWRNGEAAVPEITFSVQWSSIESVSLNDKASEIYATCFRGDSAPGPRYTLAAWDARTTKMLRSAPLLDDGRIESAITGTDASKAIGCDLHGPLLWDGRTGIVARRFSSTLDSVLAVAISRLGNRALVTGWKKATPHLTDGVAIVFDTQTGRKICEIVVPDAMVLSGALSADGRRAILGLDERDVLLCDADTGEIRRRIRAPSRWHHAVSISNDGKRVAFASEDHSICVCDFETGETRRVFRGHYSVVNSLRFSSDASLLLSGSVDGTARLWSVGSGLELCAIRQFDAKGNWLAYTPDGIFDGTSSARTRIAFQSQRGRMAVGSESVSADYYRQGLLDALLAAKLPRTPHKEMNPD